MGIVINVKKNEMMKASRKEIVASFCVENGRVCS